MGSSLNYMSDKERSVLERFGETLLNRLGEHLVRISAFGSKVRKHRTLTSLLSLKKEISIEPKRSKNKQAVQHFLQSNTGDKGYGGRAYQRKDQEERRSFTVMTFEE